MKLFHISDLHLGKRVYEFSMLEEQKELLHSIINHIEKEHPDAILITGDIYDKPIPPVEAVRLLDWFLTVLSDKKVPAYLIAGNHDSAQRLEFGRELIGRNAIHIAGSLGERLECFTQKDEFGNVNFYLNTSILFFHS